MLHDVDFYVNKVLSLKEEIATCNAAIDEKKLLPW